MTITTAPIRGVNQTDGMINISDNYPARFSPRAGTLDNSDPRAGNGGPPFKPRYPHIKDLHARADAAVKEMPALLPVCCGIYVL